MSDIEEECTPAAAPVVKHKTLLPAALAAVGAEGSIDDQLNLDPDFIGQATNDLDLDLDQVNDNLQDYDDNTSLEVNFGDGSSCRVSDVSSLSFQNMVLDDIDGENIDSETVEASGSRRDSVDSSDSIPNDYTGDDDAERFRGSLEEEIRRKVKQREKDPDRSLDCSDDDSYLHRKTYSDEMSMDEESDTGTMKKRREKQLLAGDDYIEEERFPSPHQLQPASQSHCDPGQQSGNNTSLDQMLAKHIREMDPGHTQVSDLGTCVGVNPLVSNSGSTDMQNPGKKRNSLEIRNNIPNVNEVKMYEGDTTLDLSRFQNSGAVPKIKKKSPGLARRLTDSPTNERDTSSSEKEMESQKQSNPPPPLKEVSSAQEAAEIQHHNGNVTASRNKTTKETKVEGIPHPFTITSDGMIRQESPMDTSMENKIQVTQGVDIENEYDYVKYARIQQGDSYVGMRLAYSSSNDSLNYRTNNGVGPQGVGGVNDRNDYLGSSRETSPEKSLHHPQHHPNQRSFSEQLQRLANVNEDSLTEIPLNGSELGQEEHKNFSLSPEATECDSAEVESVISEETEDDGKTMPAVEDGLSSSQGSDTEDNSTMDVQRPSEMLKHRHKIDIDQDMLSNQSPADDYRSAHSKDSESSSHHSTLSRPESCDMSKEAVDLAIRDIKSAIEQSKSLMLKPKDDEKGNGEEPVWVMRDNYVQKLQRQEEMRKVREEIERQQEEEYKRKQDEQGYDVEENPEITKPSFRGDGKPITPGKGYDSDDDEYDDTKKSRWNKGRAYKSLPTNREEETEGVRDPSHSYPGLSYNRYASSSASSRTGVTQGSPVQPYSDTVRTSETDRPQRASPLNSSLNTSQDTDDEYEILPPEKPGTYTRHPQEGEYDTDEETDELLDKQYSHNDKIDIPELRAPPVNRSAQAEKRRSRARQVALRDPSNETVLIEGVLFRARYLGSTQLISEGQPSKTMRMMQAQEAVGRIKAPEGENQPSTEVDLFVSTEKIMVLNTDLQEIMMDHSLRTISYIADIGDIIVIMARRRTLLSPGDESKKRKPQQKILCHVFESEEAQLIAQSIGQAFQVAYMEFLKANGIEDPVMMKEMDYQEVLNQQEIYGEELYMFSNKEMQKEVIVPKLKTEPLGVVIVESGWGSMVPTVVLANMQPGGAAARCGQLNIGDQIISINGISLVGLPLSSCQNYIKAAKNQTVVKLTVVSCPPVVEVLIKRPDVKYQLGFSVQNGVICSLLRGGIAERGGVRVGHRIIEINGQSVVAVPHEKIVNMLATSVGEIHMKTMPTSIFRLLTGQETPHYL